jgi:hypothetical protein
MKSFYEILEVAESATTDQIHSAYLRMAREYHPDRVPEHLTKLRADAEEKFKLIQQAWSVLNDPAKRSQYDRMNRHTDEPPVPHGYAADSAKPPSSQADRSGRSSVGDFLRSRQGFVKWALVVLIATLVLVVIGEVVVSRQSNPTPAVIGDESQQQAVVTVPPDIRKFTVPPRHVQTWPGEGGKGVEVGLVGIAQRSDETEITFRMRAGEHGDLLLYEPAGASGRSKKILGKIVTVDRDFGELYIKDNSGARYVSTSGFIGGRQTDFNLYNFTRRINFRPHEEVLLTVKFPAIAHGVPSITFVSPSLGKWQPEWRWPEISLK